MISFISIAYNQSYTAVQFSTKTYISVQFLQTNLKIEHSLSFDFAIQNKERE